MQQSENDTDERAGTSARARARRARALFEGSPCGQRLPWNDKAVEADVDTRTDLLILDIVVAQICVLRNMYWSLELCT
jgi:hypothetical protein